MEGAEYWGRPSIADHYGADANGSPSAGSIAALTATATASALCSRLDPGIKRNVDVQLGDNLVHCGAEYAMEAVNVLCSLPLPG